MEENEELRGLDTFQFAACNMRVPKRGNRSFPSQGHSGKSQGISVALEEASAGQLVADPGPPG